MGCRISSVLKALAKNLTYILNIIKLFLVLNRVHICRECVNPARTHSNYVAMLVGFAFNHSSVLNVSLGSITSSFYSLCKSQASNSILADRLVEIKIIGAVKKRVIFIGN